VSQTSWGWFFAKFNRVIMPLIEAFGCGMAGGDLAEVLPFSFIMLIL
jgi:hypothetical protein